MLDTVSSGQVLRPALSSPTIGADELGRLLMPSVRKPARWLQTHHARLTANDGLPRKLPGGWVWSRPAVMAWMEHYGAPRETRAAAGANVVALQRKAVLAAFGGQA